MLTQGRSGWSWLLHHPISGFSTYGKSCQSSPDQRPLYSQRFRSSCPFTLLTKDFQERLLTFQPSCFLHLVYLDEPNILFQTPNSLFSLATNLAFRPEPKPPQQSRTSAGGRVDWENVDSGTGILNGSAQPGLQLQHLGLVQLMDARVVFQFPLSFLHLLQPPACFRLLFVWWKLLEVLFPTCFFR